MAARASPKSRIIHTLDLACRRTLGRDINNKAIAANAPRSVRVAVGPSEANSVLARAPPHSSDVAESSTRTGAGIRRAGRDARGKGGNGGPSSLPRDTGY